MNEILNSKALYRTYYVAIIGLFVISTFAQRIMVGELSVAKVISAVIVAVYISVLITVSGVVKIVMSSSLAAAIVGALLIGGSQIREWFVQYIDVCWKGNGTTLEDMPASYQYAQVVLVIVVVGVIMVIIERVGIIKYLGAVAVFAVLIAELIKESSFNHAGTVLGIIYIFTILLELIQKTWKKRSQSSVEIYMVRLLPFIIIYMLVMMIMPTSDKPYDWRYTKGMYQRISDSLDKIHFNFGKKQEENYATSMAGFSDANTFFGAVEDSNNIIMTIKGDNSFVSNLYLTGRSYDTFYGKGWSQTREETSKDRFIDAMETLYAVRNYDKDSMSDYISRTKINVTFGNYHSGYTFMPLKAIEYFDGSEKSILYSENDYLKGIRRNYGDEYSFSYYQINMKSERIDSLLEAARMPIEADNWKRILASYKIYDFGYEERLAFDEKIKSDYSQTLVLSEEMENWLVENVGNEPNQYSRLKNLENALNSFEYNTNPGEMPTDIDTGEEFLDDFVLQSKSGYCTYFATAFTLFARSMGLPARYVEGFCVPVVDKSAKVTGRMAHAWSEVYFDGIGWVPFEPTPGYTELRYTSWDGNSIEDQKAAAREKYLEYQNQANEQLNEEHDLDTQKDTKTGVSLEAVSFICRLIGIVLISIDLTLIMIMLISRWRYSRLSLAEKYNFRVSENLRMMGFMGIKKLDCETFEEFRTRIEHKVNLKFKIDTRFLYDYESVCYGNHEITEEFLERACVENEKFKKNLFVHVSKKIYQKNSLKMGIHTM